MEQNSSQKRGPTKNDCRLTKVFLCMLSLFSVSAFSHTIENEQYNIGEQTLPSDSWTRNPSLFDYAQEFDDFLNEQQSKMKEFRDWQNAEFVEFMKHSWTRFSPHSAIPVPSKPEPVTPVIKDPERRIDAVTMNLPVENIISPSGSPHQAQPFIDPMEDKTEAMKGFSFDYYGTTCFVPLTGVLNYSLGGVKEQNVAEIWKRLSQDKYLPVVRSCLYWREELQLCDWGYYMFLGKMSMAYFGNDRKNEARVLQMFILTQSGYRCRMGRSGENIILLLPFEATLYDYSYLVLDDIRYYVMDKGVKDNIFVLDYTYPNTRPLSIQIEQEPKLAMRESSLRTLRSSRYPELSVDLLTNLNLMDYYNDCPLNDKWDLYVKASFSERVKEQLYPVLYECIKGRTNVEAANILLDFVQTALNYKTDDEQFGYERPLYGDETLFYPFSDCEDRAILYAILMREIKHFDVVLVNYDYHIATAVDLGNDVSGDYFLLNNRKFYVCDPTYINSSVGESMPKYRHKGAEIIKVE